LSMAPRTMLAKRWIGFSTVKGYSQPGMASTGLSAPDSEESGGLTKNAVS
jgi:hypothetical protein